MPEMLNMSVDVGNTTPAIDGINVLLREMSTAMRAVTSDVTNFNARGGVTSRTITGLTEDLRRFTAVIGPRGGYRSFRIFTDFQRQAREQSKAAFDAAQKIRDDLKKIGDELQQGIARDDARRLANVAKKKFGLVTQKETGVNLKDLPKNTAGLSDIRRIRDNIQEAIVEASTSSERFGEILENILNNAGIKLHSSSKKEKLVIDQLQEMQKRIQKIANLSLPKVDNKVAQQSAVVNARNLDTLFRNTHFDNVDRGDFQPKQVDNITIAFNKLQHAIQGTVIEEKRLAELMKAVEENGASAFLTMNKGEAGVVKQALALKNLYVGFAEAFDKKATAQANAAAQEQALFQKDYEESVKLRNKRAADDAARHAAELKRLEEAAAKAKTASDKKIAEQEIAEEKARRKKILDDLKAEEKVRNGIAAIQKQAAIDQDKREKERRAKYAPSVIGNISDSLGPIKDSFTKQGVASIQRANFELQKFYANSTITKTRLEQLFEAIRTGSIKSFGTLSTEELKAEVALRKLIIAFENAEKAGTRTAEMMINLKTGMRLLAIQQFHLVISKLTSALSQANEAGKEFEIKIAQIKTISQDANRSTEQWAQSLKQLSNSYGLDIVQTANAAYEAISNQIAKGANVTTFLNEAFTLARTTGATAEQSVNILSSAINAYGTSAVAAERYSAVLFKTADLGRVHVGELANTLGNTATLANNVGISFEEMNAAIAALTIQGIRADTSMTLLNNIMLKLLKPTKEMKNLFAEWGVANGEAAVATFGFQGVLARLNEELKTGGVARLGELASDMRAIRGQVGLTGQAFNKYTDALEAMNKAQEGYEKAAKVTAETVANKLNIEMAKLHNLFVVDIVQRWNKELVRFNDAIGGSAKSIESFVNGMLNLVTVGSRVAEMFAYLYNTADKLSGTSTLLPTVAATIIAYKSLNGILTLTAAKLVGTGAQTASLAAWNTYLAGTTNSAAAAMTGLLTVESALTLGIPLLIGGFAYAVSSFEDTKNKLANIAAQTEGELNQAAQRSLKQLNKTIDDENVRFDKAITERQQTFNRYIAAIQGALNGGHKTEQDKIKKTLEELTSSRDFELSLIGADDEQKLKLVGDRLKTLQTSILELNKQQDFEGVESKFKEMAEAAKEFTDEAQRGLDRVSKELKKFDKETENKAVEGQLKGLSDPKKIAKLEELRDKLRDLSKQALENGDTQEAKDQIQEADKLNKQLIALTDKGAKKGKGKQKGIDEEAAIRAEERKILVKQQEEYEKKVKEGRDLEKQANEQTLKGMDNLFSSMKTFKDETIAADKAVKALKESIRQLGDTQSAAAGNFRGAESKFIGDAKRLETQVYNLPGSDTPRIATDGPTQIEELRDALGKAIADYESKAKTANVGELQKLSDAVANAMKPLTDALFKDTYGGVPLTDVPDAAGQTIRQTATDAAANKGLSNAALLDYQGSSKEYNIKVGQLGQIETAMKVSEANIKKLAEGTGNAMELFNKAFKNDTDEFDLSVKKLINAQGSVVEALKVIVEEAKASKGGIPGHAAGGMLWGQGGRDRNLYYGEAGEGIMNRQATSKFAPLLAAMNSGGHGAGGLVQGGSSVNINMTNNFSGNNTQQSVETITRQIQRGVRRGVGKLS